MLAAVAACGEPAPVVLIDGRSGAGKSTLAADLVARWPGVVQLVALDQVYPGWDGLAAGVDAVRDGVLAPHFRRQRGVWRRWDWAASAAAEEHEVDARVPLIVEGSGILTAATEPLADVRVWLVSPDASRRTRALQRDGEMYRPHWERWAHQEEQHVATDRPADRATIRVAVP